MEIKEQRFGIEIEMTGLTRRAAANVAAGYFRTYSEYDGGSYYTYSVSDTQGRKWKFLRDASIECEKKQGGVKIRASEEYSVEMVSPICCYEDIETIQELIRKLRSAGAFSNQSCGIHIHVDASSFNANTLRNITNIMASKEDLIYKALRVHVDRERTYCKKVDGRFLEELNRKKPKTREEVSRIWYNDGVRTHGHYNTSRYHCLNLHSVFTKGTIEFRLFNSDIQHAGKIKAYIQLSLAITAQALNQRSASRTKTQTTNEKYTFRTWLLRLGMIGNEFNTARKHLLEHLDGCIAWRDPEQARRQRDRRLQERETGSGQAQQNTAVLQRQTEDENEPHCAEEGLSHESCEAPEEGDFTMSMSM